MFPSSPNQFLLILLKTSKTILQGFKFSDYLEGWGGCYGMVTK